MKKLLTIMLVAVGVSAFAETDLEINGNFKDIKGNMPVGWTQNKGKWAEPFGNVEIVKEADGKNCVKVTSTSKSTHIYTSKHIPAVAGDTIKIEVKYKGTGKGAVGIYIYTEKSRWALNEYKSIAASEEWAESKFTFTVKDKSEEKKAAKIRIVFIAEKNSSITFNKIEAEKE